MFLTVVVITGGIAAFILVALIIGVLVMSGGVGKRKGPGASAWDKQVASDLLDEVVLTDAREKVVSMMRRAIGPAAGEPQAIAETASSQPVKQPIA